MKELLVTIYVLSLQQEFDLFIPIFLNTQETINLIQDSIVEMSEGNYVKKDNAILITESGKQINGNNPIKYSGLTNGCRVLMI